MRKLSILVDKLLIQSGETIAGGRCKQDKLIAARIHRNNRHWPVPASSGRTFPVGFLDLASSLFLFLLHLLSSPPTYTLPHKSTTTHTTPNLLQASINLNRNSSLNPPTPCLPVQLPLAVPIPSPLIRFTSASVASGKSFHPISRSYYILIRSNPLL
jgi:hypothetical protein